MGNKKIREASDKLWEFTGMLHEIWMESDEVMNLVDSQDWMRDYHSPVMDVLMRMERLAAKVGPGNE